MHQIHCAKFVVLACWMRTITFFRIFSVSALILPTDLCAAAKKIRCQHDSQFAKCHGFFSRQTIRIPQAFGNVAFMRLETSLLCVCTTAQSYEDEGVQLFNSKVFRSPPRREVPQSSNAVSVVHAERIHRNIVATSCCCSYRTTKTFRSQPLFTHNLSIFTRHTRQVLVSTYYSDSDH